MAEIKTRSERSRSELRPPLAAPPITGADLQERLSDLPRYRPPGGQKSRHARKAGDSLGLEGAKTVQPSAKPPRARQNPFDEPDLSDEEPQKPPVKPQGRPASSIPPKPAVQRPDPQAPRPAINMNRPNLPPLQRAYPEPRGRNIGRNDSPIERYPQDRPDPETDKPKLPPLREQKPQPVEPRVEEEARQGPPVQPRLPQPGEPETPPAPARAAPASPPPLQPRLQPAPRPRLPTLAQLLDANPGLPRQTAIFGIGEDGLPVLLDLNDPTPGPVLVISDERPQQIELLRLAVESLALRNTARGAQFIVFSHLPGAWRSWVSEQGYDRYCMAVVGVDEPKSREWLDRLKELVEQRQAGEVGGPPVLVLMDTLNFITKLPPEKRAEFDWLVREGAAVKIWPVAAISTTLASTLSRQISMFQTLIFGYTDTPAFYVKMAGVSEADARSFGRPGQFAVKVGQEEDAWLRFSLPSG